MRQCGVPKAPTSYSLRPRAHQDSATLPEPRPAYASPFSCGVGGPRPMMTHFDGYLIRTDDGRIRLQALAGGDVRYGGLYDLVGVGRDYDSDHLVARFAVVHRERMVVW